MSKVAKYVITGPSSCGKTTVIDELKRQGYYTGMEAARIILKRYPKEPDCIKQRKMIRLQHRIETVAQERSEAVFLDRGLGDMTAYSKYMGVELIDCEDDSIASYDKVFFLDGLPFKRDGIRWEKDQEQVDLLAQKVRTEYERLGVPIVNVPAQTVDLRVDYILRNR